MFSSNHLLEIGLTALLEAPHTHLYLNFWREVVLRRMKTFRVFACRTIPNMKFYFA